ncbi:MAG: SDR family NAD(P)-dependent oxidoreductase, partial [Deltaproteobacteria bacterium]|nr:SDR family NAD(P)-dependent oxidoreductase [Deltaproteobacteria bacterium]
MERRMNFKGQVVLITGGSKGIGKAIAWAFARKGASVIINYGHDEDPARQIESQIQQTGGKAQIQKADVTRNEEVNGMFKEILDQYQRLDVLVNNAGIVRDGHMMLMSDKDWNAVVDTNLKG